MPIFNSNGDWTLHDDKGQAIPLTGSGVRGITQMNGKSTVEYSLTFLLQKDQVPAKLAYNSSRYVTLDIPFTLKDVPLP